MTLSSDTRRAAGVVHPCLAAPARSIALAEARLTDRRKVAVLLEAAGLLSLLDRAGWRLAVEWDAARIAPTGELVMGADGAAPGRSSRPAQEILLGLLQRLFGEGAAVGPGEARRAIRELADLWRQAPAPVSADEAVAAILEAAPFLWEWPDLALARQALAGEIVGAEGAARLWVAGPRFFRGRLTAAAPTLRETREVLGGPLARTLWERAEAGTPRELAAAGRWRAALAAWERQPPASEAERIERASTLAALGRGEAALDALAGLNTPAARALAARCQLELGRLGAARATLKAFEEAPLAPAEIAELAEIASRVYASHGKPGRAGYWIRRALDETAGSPRASLLARLAAAGAAWDRGDGAALERFLAASRGALDDADLAWRWHQLRALQAGGAGDLEGAATAAALAVRAGRRRLTRRRAAGLWNDLGFARAGRGDLAGAERAFLHAARLEAGCDGPRKSTLTLYNLAEIRVRQGRTAGVREIAARSESENRRSGNLRGLAQDAELWARYELALGRPAAALAVCRAALEDLGCQRLVWRVPELRLLAARALGWLREPEEAAAELADVPAAALAGLEPEERPALRALAGDSAGARREAAGSPLAPLWEVLLTGSPPPARDWEALAALGSYRAARLIFDLDLLLPGSAPAVWRREAIATFRNLGAVGFAERLEARDGGPWAVVALMLQSVSQSEPAGELSPSPVFEPGGGEKIVGESPVLLAAIDRIDRLAPGGLPVLILGESGTGKELAARRLHRRSPRTGRPFVAVNCAALSETLLLSDLFGHVRGAFTGADRDRKGVFESAHGGTVFLDEIGDLPLAAQGLLLRVLQEGEIRRLGESETRRVDVRVLAATHRDLAGMMAEGSFRRDLYFRLRVGCVEMPPLRDRGDDLLRIAERILDRLRPPAGLAREARTRLLAYRWPGNIRELENVLSVAAALAGGGVIAPEHLELPGADDGVQGSYHQQIDALRRRLVAAALAECDGNHSRVAGRLGVSRQSVSYLIRQLGLEAKRKPRRG
ncbi:MAG TPA: sigma 54-interacting transcriptional regulator [Thermoanaerobaculia bacterium]|nr:sigma 54-interacting transcriptional regulator [Thermoanaerobaculia bacterium]